MTFRFLPLDLATATQRLPDLHALTADQKWMAWEDSNYLYDLPDKWILSRLIFQGDVLIGYALCSRKGDQLWLHRLVVGEHHRGKGVGEAAIEELFRIAESNGLARVSLKTPAANAGTVRFYTRSGFAVTTQENEYVTFTRERSPLSITVGIHQPNYLPWLGYFYKIRRSDVFVILDDAEFSSGSYVNRTQILIQGAPSWLSVPVTKTDPIILKMSQAGSVWVNKHIKTLEANYGRAPFFDAYRSEISETLRRHAGGSVSEMNADLILLVCNWLRLSTKIVRSSAFDLSETSDDRLIKLVQLVGGTRYLSGKGGANYQDPEKFSRAGIQLAYTDFKPTPYSQRGGDEFVPGLSILDALFNLGADGTRALLDGKQV